MFRLSNVLMEEAGEQGGSPPEIAPSQPEAPSLPPDWKSLLPAEMQDSASLQDVPDLQTLVKNYEHTKAMVGSSVRIPTDEAGAEDIAAFRDKILEKGHLGLMQKPDLDNAESLAEVYKALGRPEDVSGYKAPEDVNGELFGLMAETALELGLSNRQYEGLAKKLADQQKAEYEQHEEKKAQGIAQLKGELGPAYDERVSRAAQAAEALNAPADLIAALKDGTANAEAIRFMDTVATQLGREGSPMAQQLGQVTESTVADLKQRIIDRTNTMLKENLSPQEHQELIKRNLADQEKLASYRN